MSWLMASTTFSAEANAASSRPGASPPRGAITRPMKACIPAGISRSAPVTKGEATIRTTEDVIFVPGRVYAAAMNRIDRLYALVEELRAAGPRGRTARQLAEHFEVSVRTIERDLSALGQAGVPLATKQGRTGGYTLDRSMSLPPLNFTPREAAAVAVALSRSEHVLFTRDARSALQKIVAAMPERALRGGARDRREGQAARPTRARPRCRDRRDHLASRARQPRAAHPLHRRRRPRDRARGRAAARRGRPQRLLPHRLVPPERGRPGVPHGSHHPSRADARRCRARSASSRSRSSTATRRSCRSRRCVPKISCQTPT